eukprot:TRINITY_DN44707_c0_g1_i1.p1 TRINITY_DN44707_c0_g1~~TRINITY_DN44707_c0_g1_i1.p1  ORF type:complete len:264 (-),score=20.73 TRINITY_DN44707_c0_g1_i1:198-953(-)
MDFNQADLFTVIEITVFVFLVLATCGMCYKLSAIGKSLRAAIQRWDTSVLGLDIEIGDCTFNLCGGMTLHDIRLMNPPGFTSPYLIRVEEVNLKMNSCWIALHGPTNIEIKHAIAERVEIIVEKTFTSSNVQEAARTIITQKRAFVQRMSDLFGMVSPRTPRIESTEPLKPAVHTYEFHVHKANVNDITVRMHGGLLAGHMHADSLEYSDFYNETGKTQIGEIIKTLALHVIQRADRVGLGAGAPSTSSCC